MDNEIARSAIGPHRFEPLPAKKTACIKCTHPESHPIHVDVDATEYEPTMEIPSVYDSH